MQCQRVYCFQLLLNKCFFNADLNAGTLTLFLIFVGIEFQGFGWPLVNNISFTKVCVWPVVSRILHYCGHKFLSLIEKWPFNVCGTLSFRTFHIKIPISSNFRLSKLRIFSF